MKDNNTLIANFLGLELQEDNTYFDYEVNEYINQEDLNYNTSWDMLMQVVDKIESLGYYTQIDNIGCVISHDNSDVIVYNSRTKKEAVYNACVEFIEWWNRN